MAGQRRGTLYVGVTSDPIARVHQHREGTYEGFTSSYGVKRLVHIEYFATMNEAIAREKQIKRWHRQWKINLIEASNPAWRDLALGLGFPPLGEWRVSRVDAETSSA